MGVWGVGLYSSDFAQDLRAAVKAVARLPLAPEDLVNLLRQVESSAADDQKDSDHTVFWLTVADQFAKRGIDSPDVRSRALAIIQTGADLVTMKALGMDDRSLTKRRAMLEELRVRLTPQVPPPKPRKTLKAPQELVFRPGDVVSYPICAAKPVNPYASKNSELVKSWHQDKWGAFVVAECGLEFGFLAWYRPLVICEPLQSEPTLADLMEPRIWLLRNPGTLSSSHASKMQLRSIGSVAIDPQKLSQLFRNSPRDFVVNDISIANSMNVRDVGVHDVHRVRMGRPTTPRLNGLTEIIDSRV